MPQTMHIYSNSKILNYSKKKRASFGMESLDFITAR